MEHGISRHCRLSRRPASLERAINPSLSLCRQFRRYADRAVSIHFERNEPIYTSGEQGKHLFLIEAGWVKRVSETSGGKVSINQVLAPGDLLGEDSLLGSTRRDSAIAMGSCSLAAIKFEDLLRVIRSNDLLAAWTEYLTFRIRQNDEIIRQFSTLQSEQRLAARLLSLSALSERPNGDTVHLPCRLTHEDLAALVGTTRSRIGVFLTRFERLGLVCRLDDHLVVAPHRLRAHLC